MLHTVSYIPSNTCITNVSKTQKDLNRATGRKNVEMEENCYSFPTPTTTTTTTLAPTAKTSASADCCPMLELVFRQEKAMFLKQANTFNDNSVYLNIESGQFLWYSKYKSDWIWIVSPQVGSTNTAMYIGNQAVACPTDVHEKKWFYWANKKFNPGIITLKCATDSKESFQMNAQTELSDEFIIHGNRQIENYTKDSKWLEWTEWSPCSFKKCDGKEMRTRTRYCQNPTDDGQCIGESFQKSACPVNECVQLRWVYRFSQYASLIG